MAHLRGDLQHKENLQTLHVNAAIQQLYSFVQVVLSGQWNHQLQGGGGEKKKEEKKNLKYSDLNNLINWVILFDHLWKCTQQQKHNPHTGASLIQSAVHSTSYTPVSVMLYIHGVSWIPLDATGSDIIFSGTQLHWCY